MSWNLEKITHSWVKEAFNKEKVQHPPSILVFSETVFKPPLGGLGAKNKRIKPHFVRLDPLG